MDGVTGLSPRALRSDVAAFPHPQWLAVLVGSELMGDPIRAISPPPPRAQPVGLRLDNHHLHELAVQVGGRRESHRTHVPGFAGQFV